MPIFRVFAFAEVEGWLDIEAPSALEAAKKADEVMTAKVEAVLPEDVEVRHAEWEYIEDSKGRDLTTRVMKEEEKP